MQTVLENVLVKTCYQFHVGEFNKRRRKNPIIPAHSAQHTLYETIQNYVNLMNSEFLFVVKTESEIVLRNVRIFYSNFNFLNATILVITS